VTAVLLFAALSAADLQVRFLETRLPSDKQAWYAACVREADGTWRLVGEYRIEDDPEKGVMTAPGETILYDPDTSRRRKEEEKK
jgi:hypothetical protein